VGGMRSFPLPFICPVAGVSFRQEVVCSTRAGDAVSVVAVDDNPHDPQAVEVRTARGELLGFIPSTLATRLRAGGGRSWHGEITEVLQGQTWGLRVRVVSSEDAGGVVEVAGGDEGDVLQKHEAADRESVGVGVRAVSGRFLGLFAGLEDDVVVVRRPDGSLCRYPASVVNVGELQASH
jgi:hypothetical protein